MLRDMMHTMSVFASSATAMLWESQRTTPCGAARPAEENARSSGPPGDPCGVKLIHSESTRLASDRTFRDG
jgi:hypothetical protein